MSWKLRLVEWNKLHLSTNEIFALLHEWKPFIICFIQHLLQNWIFVFVFVERWNVPFTDRGHFNHGKKYYPKRITHGTIAQSGIVRILHAVDEQLTNQMTGITVRCCIRTIIIFRRIFNMKWEGFMIWKKYLVTVVNYIRPSCLSMLRKMQPDPVCFV